MGHPRRTRTAHQGYTSCEGFPVLLLGRGTSLAASTAACCSCMLARWRTGRLECWRTGRLECWRTGTSSVETERHSSRQIVRIRSLHSRQSLERHSLWRLSKFQWPTYGLLLLTFVKFVRSGDGSDGYTSQRKHAHGLLALSHDGSLGSENCSRCLFDLRSVV